MTPDHARDVVAIGDDPDAFEAFYREHLEAVQRFIARRVSDPHLAADLTADVFLAAIDAASSYRADRGSPAGWLMGIARNVVGSEVRRQARQRRLVGRIAGRRLLDVDSVARIESRIDAERVSRELYAALAQLPARDRALMELVALDGLTVAEAAAVLGVKPGTARVRLHRSRRLVQSDLQPHTLTQGGPVMSTTIDPRPLDTFETELLTALRAEVAGRAAPPRRHPRRRWAVAGIGAAAAATAIGVTSLLQPPSAYAVEEQDDGDIVVTIRSLEDAEGLEQALVERGVDAEVDYDRHASLPDANAQDPTEGQRSEAEDDEGDRSPNTVIERGDLVSLDADGCILSVKHTGSGSTFQLPADVIESGATLHITTAGTQDGPSSIAVRWDGGMC